MNVLAIDQSFRATGWVWGPAGAPARHGKVRMKRPDEGWETATFNMAGFLLDFLKGEPVDIIAYESPMPPGVFAQKDGEGRFRPQNTDGIIAAWVLGAAIEVVGQTKGIQTCHEHRQTVLRHFTGKGRWGDRAEAKRQTIARCILLKYVPPGFKDDDVCDAFAIHDYTSAIWCRVQPKELVMFDPPAPLEKRP